jgi:TonB family protein
MIRKLAVAACSAALTACASAPPQPAPSSGRAVATHQVAPRYPRELSEAGMQGCVLASFLVLPNGRADKYRIEDSVPEGMFNHATLTALNQWRFEQPPRPGRYAYLVNYRLEGGRPIKPQRECKPVPSFEELNPEAAKP